MKHVIPVTVNKKEYVYTVETDDQGNPQGLASEGCPLIPVYTCRTFPYSLVTEAESVVKPEGNSGGKGKKEYIDAVCSFDIESTNIPSLRQSVMYIWQFSYNNQALAYGRTWEEFRVFLDRFVAALAGRWSVWFIHNLSYEFQFLAGIYYFAPEEVMLMGAREVLRANMFDAIELRCSYKQSNMSLKTLAKNYSRIWVKMPDFDYSLQRFADDPLTPFELLYSFGDVLCLTEAMQTRLQNESLYTLPLTSTGYVRRDVKRVMKGYYSSLIKMIPDIEIFELLQDAFRGGDTHANRRYSSIAVCNVHSFDMSSAYHYAITCKQFPMSDFRAIPDDKFTWEYIAYLMNKRHRALLLKVRFWALVMSDPHEAMPYLTKDKALSISNGEFDNGRVLKAEEATYVITDIDLRIIVKQYQYAGAQILQCYHARYGKLPDKLIEYDQELYRQKTALKDVPGKEIEYALSKGKYNAIYGMMVQNPLKASIEFIDGAEREFQEVLQDPSDAIRRYYKVPYSVYQWGVWVTAWCRYMLFEGRELVNKTKGAEMIYQDTDSLKFIGNVDFSALNNERLEKAVQMGSYAYDPSGKAHYIGVFEEETGPEGYKEFKTFGAKKYAYTDDKGLHLTCSGVNKEKGAAELGSLENFEIGFTFVKAGGTQSVYNDKVDEMTTIAGHRVHITRNVFIEDSTYTLGITPEYEALLKDPDAYFELSGAALAKIKGEADYE